MKPKQHEPLNVGFEEALRLIADEQRPSQRTLAARPFLKWVGGKRSVLPELIKRMPKEYTLYHEPFLGGGALFFAVQPERAYLSDVNFHLILTFRAVKENPDEVIRLLKIHASKHSKDYYLKSRERMFKEKDPIKTAALFIYLNKTCYNGLYRVNQAGKFNVPMGDYKDPAILDEDNIRNCSRLLQGTELYQGGFGHIVPLPRRFYYLDPPYHETYDGYNGAGFGDKEHIELAEFCKEVDRKKGYFMLSNSDTSLVRTLYKGYNIEQISASRSVSCKGNQRGKENELIIRNYE